MKRIRIAAEFDYGPEEIKGLIEFLSDLKADAAKQGHMPAAIALTHVMIFMNNAISVMWPTDTEPPQ